MTLTVEWTRAENMLVVTVGGEIDTSTAGRLAEEIAHARTGDEDSMVLDLTAVDFLDSAGLAALVELASLCHKAGQPFTLVATSRAVLNPLRLTGLDQIFTIAAKVPEPSHP